MLHIKKIGFAVGSLFLFPLICFAQKASSDIPKLNFTVPDYLIPVEPGLHKALYYPPCSIVGKQHKKGFVRSDDRVLAWIRGEYKGGGGAVPIRHFLAVPRVINSTPGGYIFFYDSAGDYASAFTGGGGYEFVGWRNGVMVVVSKDGTLWSTLSGRAIEGPKKGERLKRNPYLMTEWGHWLALHPDSITYDLFDGKKYPLAEMPREMSVNAKQSMGKVDDRLAADSLVLGVEGSDVNKAFPLDENIDRACYMNKMNGESVVVFWYGRIKTAVAFRPRVGDRELTFYADKKAAAASDVAPELSPFRDRETNSQWTIAGRAVTGPLKGSELEWVESVQCRWYAWAAEYPKTEVFRPKSNKKLSIAR